MKVLARSLGLVVALLAASSPFAGGQSLEPAVIRVVASPTLDIVPLVYAVQKGLFAKVGLNVEFSTMATGAAITQGVVGGSIDVGYSALTALVAGHARGVKFLVIAPAAEYDTNNPATVMVVAKDKVFNSGRDFNGKIIGVPTLKDLDALATAAWIDGHGGDSSTLKYVELPNPALLPGLSQGRIDAFTLGEPWVTQALESGQARFFAKSLDSVAPHFLISGWFSSAEYIDAHKDAIIRFERVLRAATEYANAHHPEMIPYVQSYTKLDEHVIARSMRFRHGTSLETKLVQPTIDVSAKYHVIPERFDAKELISSTTSTAP